MDDSGAANRAHDIHSSRISERANRDNPTIPPHASDAVNLPSEELLLGMHAGYDAWLESNVPVRTERAIFYFGFYYGVEYQKHLAECHGE